MLSIYDKIETHNEYNEYTLYSLIDNKILRNSHNKKILRYLNLSKQDSKKYFKLYKLKKREEKSDICPVCLDEPEELQLNNKEMIVLNCGHKICSHCLIQQFINNQYNCPHCKTIIKDNILENQSEESQDRNINFLKETRYLEKKFMKLLYNKVNIQKLYDEETIFARYCGLDNEYIKWLIVQKLKQVIISVFENNIKPKLNKGKKCVNYCNLVITFESVSEKKFYHIEESELKKIKKIKELVLEHNRNASI